MRPSGRNAEEMRLVKFTENYSPYAEGSVLVEFGNTRVLATATVESRVPRFLKGKGEGWVTAEYGMLPRATHTRNQREAARGKQNGRTTVAVVEQKLRMRSPASSQPIRIHHIQSLSLR